MSGLNPVGSPTGKRVDLSSGSGDNTSTGSVFHRVTDTISSYTVEPIGKSRVWSIITSPFSFIARTCSRLLNWFRGPKTVVDRTVEIDVPGLLWGSSLTKMSVDEAIRKGYLTYEKALEKFQVDENVAKIEGWFVVSSVPVPAGLFTKAHVKQATLMHEIQRGRLTIEKALDKKTGYLTTAQADAATWIKKKEVVEAAKK